MTSDDTPVILDLGCSIAICNDRMDFVGKIHPAQDASISGIGADLPIKGIGTVHMVLYGHEWHYSDNETHGIGCPEMSTEPFAAATALQSAKHG